ncbi:MAG TPA: aminotransferase class III-fold pyridoxal phosphate-dependent enzyme [Paenirhodobacter sp.]
MTTVTRIESLNRFDPDSAPPADPETARALARRRRNVGSSSILFYREPLEIVRGEGCWLYAADGRRFLDVYNNVQSVGHCHPHVVEAMARQAALLTTHTRYLGQTVDAYMERLLATFGDGMDNLVMTCTGTESNDLALRLAAAVTGKTGVVVTQAAYHGNNAAVGAVSPSSAMTRDLAPHVRSIALPPSGAADAGVIFARNLQAAIDALEASGHGFSTLLVDTIFSSDGVFADPAGFLAEALAVTHAAGGLFIADEVQPGFGRTGGGLWGYQRHAIAPDIVTMGKPMGNGYPMGGVAMRSEILDAFTSRTGYFNTFGGNAVAAATGAAVLDVIETEGLVENAATTGAYLKQGLIDLAATCPRIGEVRGAGLFVGIDIIDPATGAADSPGTVDTINSLKNNGILIGAAGLNGNTLKIRPPLCFGKAEADVFIETIGRVLGA